MLRCSGVMHWGIRQIGEVSVSVLALAVLGWCFSLWFRRRREPAALALRLGITLALGLGWFLWERKLYRVGGGSQIVGVLLATVFGFVMAAVWTPSIVGWVGNVFGGLFDGGSEQVEAKPFYSIFRSKRSKGKYYEALAEVRRQLEKFPNDFEGYMLLAELQAENMDDLPGAELTIQRCCNQSNQTPGNISFALNKLADWHLGLTRDREGAQRVLEKIVELLPNTEMSMRAAQRISHLADTDLLLAPFNRERIEAKRGALPRGADGRLKAPEIDWEKQAAEYVAQLERHPLDTHAREKLAEIYAKHYHRLDLAVEQLELLIEQPNQPVRQVVHWLNLMADLQVLEGAEIETARATLQRIVDLFPDSAAAQTAQRRMNTLKLEANARETPKAVQLGIYEQDIGLKMKRKK